MLLRGTAATVECPFVPASVGVSSAAAATLATPAPHFAPALDRAGAAGRCAAAGTCGAAATTSGELPDGAPTGRPLLGGALTGNPSAEPGGPSNKSFAAISSVAAKSSLISPSATVRLICR